MGKILTRQTEALENHLCNQWGLVREGLTNNLKRIGEQWQHYNEIELA